MEAQAATRRDLETALIEKCWRDPDFKKQVISDPKGMLERHTGQKLPEQIKIFIHEEDANTLHFSIPAAPSNLTELSDDDLERVAGGTELIVGVIAGTAAVVGAVATAASATAAVTLKKGW
jgi:Nitrile hydratase, alpha chain